MVWPRPEPRFLSRQDLRLLYAAMAEKESDQTVRDLAQTRLRTLDQVKLDTIRDDLILNQETPSA